MIDDKLAKHGGGGTDSSLPFRFANEWYQSNTQYAKYAFAGHLPG